MKKTITFIKKSNDIHNNKYDYSLVNYINNKLKVKIICPVHGIFEQTPNSHLNGRGCPKCGGTEKLTTSEFINRSNLLHNYKYLYDNIIYKNLITNVKIICPIHGEFEQLPIHHLNGSGCPNCKGNKQKTIEQFISDSIKIHGSKYDYSLVKYINNYTKVKIICKKHGVFEQRPKDHLDKCGCLKCSGLEKLNTNEFINIVNKIHGNKYDYSLTIYINMITKIKIICPIHGVFEQRPKDHIHNKQGCPKCSRSKGELEIKYFLEKYNINFIEQKKFINCKYIKLLPFDFYLPKYNICIEFDGEQHFNEKHYFNIMNDYINQIKRDDIKTKYCIDNNIQLIRLNLLDNIENKICEIIKINTN